MYTKNIIKIGIIGGGAAGLMAAASIIESKTPCQIYLFDKNKQLGSKVIISGGGRCNVTTGITNPQQLLKNYTRGSEFLKAALSKFTPQMVYDWFEGHNVPLKMQDDMRAFPVSDDGHDIVAIFENLFKKYNVNIHLQEPILNVSKIKDLFILETKKRIYEFDKIIITTGGNAYRQTGSTGDGYAFAKDLGHTITQLGPSLNSFVAKEEWVHNLSGLSFLNSRLQYKNFKSDGPFLFTHFGISGPVTFSLSSKLTYEEISKDSPLEITLIPYANTTFTSWEQKLKEILTQNPKKQIKNILQSLFPERFAITLLRLSNIPSYIKSTEISKMQRQKLSHLLSDQLKITLLERRPGDEFVTAGGISTDEINAQTMESLICPGLYFGGEIMNIDGVTGGFNLQSSWATGKLAGSSISKFINKIAS